jgi:tetratricopeptide (TPR) repeat protein
MAPTTRKSTPAPPRPANPWPARLTTAAFIIALALVAARAMMIEFMRDPFPVVPDVPSAPLSAGPATTLVLNLLAWIPALLVLVRATVDRSFRIRWHLSHLPLAALALWIAASVLWAGGDRFAAAIGASTLASAFVLLWAMTQLCDGWRRLRIVAGIAFGLLLVYIAQAAIYRYVEWPVLVETWQEQREDFLQQRGWTEGDFHAQQFERKILAGEMVGFSASANTFAAMLVLLGVISAGVAVQRLASRDEPLWPIIVLLSMPLAAWAIWHTQSRTALLTPFIAAGILLLVRMLRPHLARRPRLFYSIALVLIALAAAAVIGHGLRHGTLVHETLTFRWHYWTASFHLFRDYWLTGVGWNNFGQHYLAYRLPQAPEEIKDPHNFIVRFFTEAGLVGGFLLLAWLLRLWWELSRPILPPADPEPRVASDGAARGSLAFLLLIAAAAVILNILAALDLSLPLIELSIDLLRRGLFLCLLMGGLAVVCMRSTQEQWTDARPGPWILYALLAALGVFFVHNLIDFAMFENGPMFAFALLIGSALGIRTEAGPEVRDAVPPRPPIPIIITALAVLALLWLAMVFGLLIPTAAAESAAHRADDHIRDRRFFDAAAELDRAHQALPINADYAYRAARALAFAQAPPQRVRDMLARAIASDPLAVEHYLMRARYDLSLPETDARQVIADYERALQLNPNDVPMRLEYAEALQTLGRTEDALHQYRLALHYNDQLHPHEPKRLTPQQEQQLRRRMADLE